MSKVKVQKGYAIVSPAGKIQLETVGPTKAHPLSMMMDWDRAKGCKIMRVSVVVEMPAKKRSAPSVGQGEQG